MRRLTLPVLLLVTSCAYAKLDPAARDVRVTSNTDAVRGCTLKGEVTGADALNGGLVGQGAAEKNAMVKLRNEAAKIGANVVLLSTGSTNFSGSRYRGEAYACAH